MGAVLGTGSKKSANIDINIIPFVDVMSCLTAFLLVFAVWVNTAHLKNEAAGKGRDTTTETQHPRLAVLIEWDQMLVTATPGGETRQLAVYDWAHLGDTLKELRPAGEEDPRVEIAAESTNAHPISYQQIVAAMDTSVRAGFADVGVTDVASLTR
ncbi:MAG TPA: biopolymer transporter ExbD [Kofleriaceae bacterium]|nr:biopolymer transporter ExbD [Kofleriaceae bacterium]